MVSPTMEYYTEMKIKIRHRTLNESSQTQKYILHDSMYIKFKSRHNQSWMLKVTIVVALVAGSDRKEHREGLGTFCYLIWCGV